MYIRFSVQAGETGSMVLDKTAPELIAVAEPLIQAAQIIARIVNSRDCDAYVEVSAAGVGLAMAGLLRAHQIRVVQSHYWDE